MAQRAAAMAMAKQKAKRLDPKITQQRHVIGRLLESKQRQLTAYINKLRNFEMTDPD